MQQLTSSVQALAVHRRLNRTAVTYPRERSVPELFAVHADRSPDAAAVVHGERTMTYGELERRANGLADHLLERGLEPGSAVGVSLPRSPDLIVALLAILKCAGSYLPFDPAWPDERLRTLLDAADCDLVLGDGHPERATEAGGLRGRRFVSVPAISSLTSASAPAPPPAADAVAYINFTSGSTGRPKGVPIQHRSIARLVCDAAYAPLDETSRLLQLAPVTFDAATFEIWGALLRGGTCVLYPDPFVRISRLARVLREQRISVLFLTTALFNTVIDEMPEAFASVGTILTGGESHSIKRMALALRLYGPKRLVNVYGPTEATTFATYHPVDELPDDATTLPIGRPIQNTRLYLVDGDALCEPGRRGEICLAGDGLSPGYLGMPELTAERFVDRLVDGAPERLYRTGDYGHLLPDGEVVFQGREDDQVKVRGFRIELGEIAHHLDGHPAVGRSYVTVDARTDDKRVVAFVIPADASCTPATLTEHLRARLPGYMVPEHIQLCRALPLTATGKIDRHALLAGTDRTGPKNRETR